MTFVNFFKFSRSKLFLSFLFFMIFFSSASFGYEKELKNLALNLIEKIGQTQKSRVAVVDFTDLSGNNSEFGRFISENLSTFLMMENPSFEVIDRMHLKKMMSELKLAETLGDLTSEGTQQLSAKTGVEALITGSYMAFDDYVRLTIKVIEAGSAKILTAATGELPKTKAIADLLNRGVDMKSVTPKALSSNTSANFNAPQSQGLTTSSPVSSEKNVRDLGFSMNNIRVSTKNIVVTLTVRNNSDKAYRLNYNASKVNLSDLAGNEFDTKGLSSNKIDFGPLSTSDFALTFPLYGQKSKNIGEEFGISIEFDLDSQDQKTTHTLSFSGIKAIKSAQKNN